MIKEIEEKFIKNFFIKEKQERILFELSSNKKRGIAINKFISLLNNKLIVFSECKISDDELLFKISQLININNDCYVMADRSNNDGKYFKFKEIFYEVMQDGCMSVLVCENNVAFLKEELAIGSPAKIILKL